MTHHPTSTLFPYTTLFRSAVSREWVDDLKPAFRNGPDIRDKRWVMRCDCWHPDHGRDEKGRANRCRTEGQPSADQRSEEHTSELQSRRDLVCRLLLEKKN